MNKRKLFIETTVAVVFAAVITGCGTTPRSSFYMIDAVRAPRVADVEDYRQQAPHVGVRRVEVPGYLARNEMVFRKNGAEVSLAPLHRWAEPLRESVPRVLAENISTLLDSNRVSIYPWTTGGQPDHDISIRIVRFDAADDGNVTLIAHWQVTTDAGGQPVMRKSIITQPFSDGANGGPDYGRIALAHGRALAELSREIVGVVQKAD